MGIAINVMFIGLSVILLCLGVLRLKTRLYKLEETVCDINLRLLKIEAKLDPLIAPMNRISRKEFEDMYPRIKEDEK